MGDGRDLYKERDARWLTLYLHRNPNREEEEYETACSWNGHRLSLGSFFERRDTIDPEGTIMGDRNTLHGTWVGHVDGW